MVLVWLEAKLQNICVIALSAITANSEGGLCIKEPNTVGSHVVFQPCNPYVMKIPETSRGCFDIYMDPKKPPMTLLSQLHPL